MIDLYVHTSPNVQKIFIALEELALPYRQTQVNVWKGEQFTPEFARLNPNRKVPVIVDHDGPGGTPITVFESGAILIYLADKTGRLLPTESRARCEALQWLMVQMTSIGPMFGQFNHFKRYAPPGNDYSYSRYLTEVRRLYDVLQARLAATPFLGGGDYGIADIATFHWVRQHEVQGIDLAALPDVKRWYDAIAARPAVQRAMDKVAAIRVDREAASTDDRDRYFGRGRFARS